MVAIPEPQAPPAPLDLSDHVGMRLTLTLEQIGPHRAFVGHTTGGCLVAVYPAAVYIRCPKLSRWGWFWYHLLHMQIAVHPILHWFMFGFIVGQGLWKLLGWHHG